MSVGEMATEIISGSFFKSKRNKIVFCQAAILGMMQRDVGHIRPTDSGESLNSGHNGD